MRFAKTPLPGAYVIDVEPRVDERGLFARTFCAREFAAHGLDTRVEQASVSVNPKSGTLRGLHYQAPPHGEAKLIRCTAGAIFDVIVDLRPGSPTYTRHYAVTLTAADRRALYVPVGFAHGFQTLADDTEVLYQMSQPFVAESARGVRWNDPAFGIAWPSAAHRTMNDRDRTYPDFQREAWCP
jgi:dTDP-4-dehydrorhamnose 3,5-epimerase